MKQTTIIDLGVVRDMLGEWEKVRQAILSGKLTGFHTALRDDEGRETIYLGGVFKDDPQAALRATLKASMARTLRDDPPMQAFKG